VEVAMIVDAHSHLFPAGWNTADGLPSDLFSVERVLERQAEAGIDVTVISDPHIWYGDRDLGDINSAREYNEFTADLVSGNPGRLVGLGSVTPWRGTAHLKEAERAVRELHLPGLAIATSDRGQYLDAVAESFWELVADLDVPIFLHPGRTVVGQELMEGYRMGELCGRPLDMTLSLARFILTGTFERHPAIRLLCAHAGGAICMVADRMDFGHELRGYRPLGPWGEVELSCPPSTFVAQLYLDTVTFGAGPLRLAMETVGTEQVCFGTDGPPVPFPPSRARDVVAELGLPSGPLADVLGENARRLFRIGSAAADQAPAREGRGVCR
jgi:aminocarboxymuconate-semialdehyde decarboxylase